ncbi:MAG: hypothetical protein ACPGVG_09500 [Mycobacterium sp.]
MNKPFGHKVYALVALLAAAALWSASPLSPTISSVDAWEEAVIYSGALEYQ